ncbi:hypothetical protein JCM6882_000867 [Rhodosporidiobolus microsporus]
MSNKSAVAASDSPLDGDSSTVKPPQTTPPGESSSVPSAEATEHHGGVEVSDDCGRRPPGQGSDVVEAKEDDAARDSLSRSSDGDNDVELPPSVVQSAISTGPPPLLSSPA